MLSYDNIAAMYEVYTAAMKTYRPYTMASFEPGILCSGGGRDDHYATPPWHSWVSCV
jgi:hypothetical protein